MQQPQLLPDSAATEAHGRAFAERLGRGGTVIALRGPLGAGKTTWTRGFAAGLGLPDQVRSPTYTYRFDYTLPDGRPFVHADLYRIPENADLTGFGLDELMDSPDAVLVIEWAEKLPFALPPQTWHGVFDLHEDGTRTLHFSQA